MKILAFAGSLREKSFNKGLLRAAVEKLSQETAVQVWDIKDIPLYNADLDKDPLPEPVKQLKDAIQQADALLIATPEYHYSVPGVLKNTLDWAGSDPDNVVEGKPTAIMGTSKSGFGTVRSQLHLRQVLFAMSARTFEDEELMVSFARKKFDENGNLADGETKEKLEKFLESFLNWIKKLQ